MFDPCHPCIGTGHRCEHCTFGYRPAEDNHKTMTELFVAYLKGERPSYWRFVEAYMNFHKDWKAELKGEVEMSEAVMETQCTSCSHREVCSFKDEYLMVQKEASNMRISREDEYDRHCMIPVSNFKWLKPIKVECKYYSVVQLVQRTNTDIKCEPGDNWYTGF